MMILHCAECDNPLMTTTGRGSYCLHCGFSPSMQDTYFKDVKVTETKEIANPCCMCYCEVPIAPDGVRSSYCSEKCWQQWLEEHKNDAVLAPYIPLQVTKIEFK